MKPLSYNLVLQDRNWVMEKLANHFHKYIPNSRVSTEADINSDINFYFNWHAMRQKTKFDVCWFTHIENRDWWDWIVSACDVAVLHGSKYKDSVPEEKRITFYPPPFENFLPQKKTKVLVVGRSYGSDRKNFEAANSIGKLDNIELTFTEGKLSEQELKEAYLGTDYVLVTSRIEAGPMCVVEALAMNKPVIAPDAGWCWDYPVIKFSNEEDLNLIFKKLSFPHNAWKVEIENLIKKINIIHDSRHFM